MSRRSRRRRGQGGAPARDAGNRATRGPEAGGDRESRPPEGGESEREGRSADAGRRAPGAGERGGRSADPGRHASGARRRGARATGPGGRARDDGAPGPLARLGVQLALLAAVLGLAVLVAELAGAANLGVAFGVGQIAFAIALVYLLLRR
jgi:hypothetical protein